MGLSIGAIVGIVIGCLVLVVLIVVLSESHAFFSAVTIFPAPITSNTHPPALWQCSAVKHSTATKSQSGKPLTSAPSAKGDRFFSNLMPSFVVRKDIDTQQQSTT